MAARPRRQQVPPSAPRHLLSLAAQHLTAIGQNRQPSSRQSPSGPLAHRPGVPLASSTRRTRGHSHRPPQGRVGDGQIFAGVPARPSTRRRAAPGRDPGINRLLLGQAHQRPRLVDQVLLDQRRHFVTRAIPRRLRCARTRTGAVRRCGDVDSPGFERVSSDRPAPLPWPPTPNLDEQACAKNPVQGTVHWFHRFTFPAPSLPRPATRT